MFHAVTFYLTGRGRRINGLRGRNARGKCIERFYRSLHLLTGVGKVGRMPRETSKSISCPTHVTRDD